jgi:hypothetical protein
METVRNPTTRPAIDAARKFGGGSSSAMDLHSISNGVVSDGSAGRREAWAVRRDGDPIRHALSWPYLTRRPPVIERVQLLLRTCPRANEARPHGEGRVFRRSCHC